jgi:hypothetical protein
VFGVRAIRSNANSIPSPAPTAASRASSSSDRSQLPNFAARYARRSIPARDMSGFNWNGCQRTTISYLPATAVTACSSRRLPT